MTKMLNVKITTDNRNSILIKNLKIKNCPFKQTHNTVNKIN